VYLKTDSEKREKEERLRKLSDDTKKQYGYKYLYS
jgi:hypothetical protein